MDDIRNKLVNLFLNAKSDYGMMTDPARQSEFAKTNQDMSMKMGTAGMTAPVGESQVFDPILNRVTHLDPANLINNIKEWTNQIKVNPNSDWGKAAAQRLPQAIQILQSMGIKL